MASGTGAQGDPAGVVARVRSANGWTVADLAGEVDLSRSSALLNALEPIVNGGGGLVINLAGVGYMDSTALATLVAARRHAADRGGRVRLAGATPRVDGLIRLTQLNRVFEIFPSVEAATAEPPGPPRPPSGSSLRLPSKSAGR